MVNLKKTFLALLTALFCTLSFASPKNTFAGKSYVATKILLDGADIGGLMSAIGMKITIDFTSASTFIINFSSMEENEKDSGTYKVNPAKKTITLSVNEETIVCSYTADFSEIMLEADGSDFLDEDGQVSVVFTEKNLASQRESQSFPSSIDYGSIKSNVFVGCTYNLSKIEMNGADVTALFKTMGGMDASIFFTSATAAEFTFIADEDEDTVTLLYTVDYATNTIDFNMDDILTGIYREKGKFITLSVVQDGLTLSLTFEKR